MTQDEIIEMARQAGFVIHIHKPSLITVENEETWVCVNKELEAFAKLVAAKERERYMQLFLDPENQPTQFGTATQQYREQEIKDEREACAKLADDIDSVWESVSNAIRARGEA